MTVFPNNPSDWRPVDPPPPQPPTSPPPRGAGRGRTATALTLVMVALFGGLIGVAVDRWISANPVAGSAPIAAPATSANAPTSAAPAPTAGSAPRIGPRARQQTSPGATASGTPASSSSPAPAASPSPQGQAATDPQQQAVQQVIEKGDQEQAQALANNDPTVMSDTATPDFYQQQVRTNQDLKANGVTAISLVNIEWGPISISGSTASATAWETWSTTYSDGTTEQNARDLIQAGTQQSVSGSGSTQYEAWVETLPQASHPVSLTVHPGDSVTVSITQQAPAQDEWLVAFKNNTTGQTFQVTEQYTSSMSSAEWIEEAPSAGRRQAPLDNFGSINFSAGSTVKDGQTVTIAGAGAHPITMIGRTGQPLATPSSPGGDGASFTISRN